MFKNIQKYVRLSLFISRPFVPLSCLFKTALLSILSKLSA